MRPRLVHPLTTPAVLGAILVTWSCSSPRSDYVAAGGGVVNGVRPPGPPSHALEGDAGPAACGVVPEAGCPCVAEGGKSFCWVYVGNGCGTGMLTCEGGRWSGCVVDQVIERADLGASLSDGPNACSPCDPDCAIARDYPTEADLPGRASPEIVYDPTADGITLAGGAAGGSLPDRDADGVPDVADDYPGDPYRDGIRERGGFQHTLPMGAPPVTDPFDFTVRVTTADVYFLFDTTGSMAGELANLRAGMTTGTYEASCPAGVGGGIIGATRCIIPNAWFGVGHFDDYPVSPYGAASSGDVVYANRLDLGPSESAAQVAVNGLVNHNGADWPESHTQALHATATGAGLGPWLPARAACPAGRWGYPCFRPDTIPIVVMFTDAPMHDGTIASYDYVPSQLGASSPPLPPTTAVTGNDTQASARFLGDLTSSFTGWSGHTCSLSDAANPGCNSANSGDAWFRFTLSSPATLRATTEGSSFDTVLAILDSTGRPIACNDDYAGLGRQSRLDSPLPAGTYYAVVDGRGRSRNRGSCGSYRLRIGVPTTTRAFPVSWNQTVDALVDRGIRVISVVSEAGGRPDAIAMAQATGSVDASGSPYVFDISSNGTGLSTAVVSAIADLARNTAFDVTARPTDDPATAIDERELVDSIVAMSSAASRARCGAIAGDTFFDCAPGTDVDFRVTFQNGSIPATAAPQLFDFSIQVLLDGLVQHTLPVRITVPPVTASVAPQGSFFRDHDATTRCEIPPQRPDWGRLEWTASLPAGTSIELQIRTGDTAARALDPVALSLLLPPTTSPVDLGELLGERNFAPYLRVTAVLRADEQRRVAPVLTGFELQYTCVELE